MKSAARGSKSGTSLFSKKMKLKQMSVEYPEFYQSIIPSLALKMNLYQKFALRLEFYREICGNVQN